MEMVQTFTWLLIYQTDEILWSGERGDRGSIRSRSSQFLATRCPQGSLLVRSSRTQGERALSSFYSQFTENQPHSFSYKM